MTIPQNKVNMHINMYAKFHPQYCPSDYPINTFKQKSSDSTNRSKGCSTSENAIKEQISIYVQYIGSNLTTQEWAVVFGL